MFSDCIRYTSNNGIETMHMMIRHENPKGLFVLLPGGNNASDRPIMHLLRKGMLDAGYDILNINYSGMIDKTKGIIEVYDDLVEMVEDVLLQRLYDYKGLNLYMFARSLGCTVAARIASKPYANLDGIAFCSPTGMAIDYIKDSECMVCLDPQDKLLGDGGFEKLQGYSNVSLRSFSDGGHNLEVDNDIRKTIEIIEDVVLSILDYYQS